LNKNRILAIALLKEIKPEHNKIGKGVVVVMENKPRIIIFCYQKKVYLLLFVEPMGDQYVRLMRNGREGACELEKGYNVKS
jgi:hypothetical protein